MTASAQFDALHPRGQATNRGQFADKRSADPGSLALAGSWEPDDSFPFPQANDMDKIALCVDAVYEGVDTAEAIGFALDVDPRQGAYYANAAGWLGLLERGSDMDLDGTVYRVSEAGEEFRAEDPNMRALILAGIVDQIDDAQEIDSNVVELRLRREGLGDNTAHRRAATMKSWRDQSVDMAELGSRITGSGSAAIGRYGTARNQAAQQRAEAHAKSLFGQPAVGGQCPGCFQTMSLTGTCDNCN